MQNTKKAMLLSKFIVFFIWIVVAWVVHFNLSLIFGNASVVNNIFYFTMGVTFSIMMRAFKDIDKRVLL